MKRIFSLQIAILALGLAARAQKPVMGCPKIIFHSSQLTDSACDSNIKKIGFSFFSDKVFIRYRNKEKTFIPEDSLWGVRTRNDYPYRLYNGNYYKLYQVSPVYMYCKKSGKYYNHYFSTTPDAPLHTYSREQLKLYTDSSTYASITGRGNTKSHKWAIDLFGSNTTIAGNNFWGGGYNIRYYPGKKFSTGLRLGMSLSRVKDTFNFSIIKPGITNVEIGWINQYDLLQNDRFKAGVSVINGFFASELLDRAKKEWVYTTRGYRNVSKKIATNTYYLLEPGVDFAFRLLSNKHATDYFFTASAKYRYVTGTTEYGTDQQFRGFLFATGLSIIGLD